MARGNLDRFCLAGSLTAHLLTAYAVNSITLSGIAIVTNSSAASPSSSLDHNLQDSFPLLSGFSSTRELEASPIYAELRAEIDRVLGGTVHESLGGGSGSTRPYLRATAWNIERGLRLAGIIRVLQEHPQLSQSDLIFVTELDYGMTRTQNRFRGEGACGCTRNGLRLRSLLHEPEQGSRP